MSKRNKQKQRKLKVNIEDFFEPLLKHLANCPKNTSVQRICELVEEKKYVVEDRQKWDSEQISLFEEIKREIAQWEENNKDESKLIENFEKLLEKYGADTNEFIKDKPNYPKISSATEVGESSNNNKQDDDGSAKLEVELDQLQNSCFHSLDIFPKNVALSKRILVYWWIGLGLVPSEDNTNITPEQQGENIFSDLVDKGILKPVHIRKHNEVIDQCIIGPTIHHNLTSNNNHKLVADINILLNVGQNYLSSNEIKKILSDNNALQVVQLGKWRCTSEVHDKIVTNQKKSPDHIEVDDTDFMKKLGKNVTYFSLRDVSGLVGLPELIGQLDNLRILDLRSCHNLEKLPPKRYSRLIQKKRKWFKNLTHLDLLECHLLDHMPKWICELSNLEVLKGFKTGEGGKKKEHCRLRDLSKLKKLRKLSIKITKPIDPEDVGGLESLNLLSVLTLTWDINAHGSKLGIVSAISFPKNLEKLDIRCYPEFNLTEFLPEVLPCLKRFYIRGGNLNKFGLNKSWNVQILRLKFLKYLESGWPEIIGIFTNLEFILHRIRGVSIPFWVPV